MDETNMMRIATGHYINFFTDNGRCDIFIIINEANEYDDCVGLNTETSMQEVINKVDDMLRDQIDKLTNNEIEEMLEPLFPYGIQIIRNK